MSYNLTTILAAKVLSNFSVDVTFDDFSLQKWGDFIKHARELEPVSVRLHFIGFSNCTDTILPVILPVLKTINTRFYVTGFELDNPNIRHATNSPNILLVPPVTVQIYDHSYEYRQWMNPLVLAVTQKSPCITLQFINMDEHDPRIGNVISMINVKETRVRLEYLKMHLTSFTHVHYPSME